MIGVRTVLVIVCVMRVGLAVAQPGCPDISFTLVSDTKGRPMPGRYAKDAITRHDLGRRGVGSWSVEEHFTSNSPYESDRNGEHTWWMSAGTPLPGPGNERSQFHFIDCWCTEHYMRIQRGTESMRIDLPDASAERWALVQHVMERSGDMPSPEVVLFRPGRFTFIELMNDTIFDKLEARLSKRLKDNANAIYKKQLQELEEYYRAQPPATTAPSAPPFPPLSPPAPSSDQPGLKQVNVDRMNADTVWVRITGRALLDGGCASDMPLFEVEMRADSGWVERIPFDLVQMDCGMPWAEWDQHVVMLPPMRWWVGAHRPEENKELMAGAYRLVLIGADMKTMHTEEFLIR